MRAFGTVRDPAIHKLWIRYLSYYGQPLSRIDLSPSLSVTVPVLQDRLRVDVPSSRGQASA